MYPTLSKLVAAVAFAALSWTVSRLVVLNFPEHMRPGAMAEINAVIGVVLGWRISGRPAGGLIESMAVGLSTGIAILFSALFVWAGHEMLRRAMRLRYEGPVEGIEDMISTMIDFAMLTWPGPALLVLGAGSIAIGLVVQCIQRSEQR
ncbi:TrgA family protein [Palleronia sp. LCG004]|uniref:TrgA family protein n=1 Tax=Palleronia sp. LCG004 TaxID=3079304 RepID=UPI002942E5A1|nr:TrgA family protein [Palleronia sp. LCG004]WOI55086.1 TrgA family protein [Palleronia sp. LCG004]